MSSFRDAFTPDASILTDAIARAKKKAAMKDKPESPLPQIRGKRFGGVLYVRAEDVADALASQSVKANERLIEKLRKAAS